MKLLTKALIFLYKKIEEIIFPKCCLICSKLNKDILCEKCKNEILKNVNVKIEYKENIKTYYDKHIYFFLYKDNIRNLILDYKFNDKPYLYKIFSEIIIKNKKIYRILKKYDIIIPVPIHKKRKRIRGYNQSELISKEISNKIETVKYENKVLQKIVNNKPQSTLDKFQRKENVKNAYKVINKVKIQNKNIIIFDDIFTTGNTVNSCAKILKENGANKIIVLTIAKD